MPSPHRTRTHTHARTRTHWRAAAMQSLVRSSARSRMQSPSKIQNHGLYSMGICACSRRSVAALMRSTTCWSSSGVVGVWQLPPPAPPPPPPPSAVKPLPSRPPLCPCSCPCSCPNAFACACCVVAAANIASRLACRVASTRFRTISS